MDDYAKSTSIDDLPPEVLVSIFEIYAESEGTAGLCTVLAKVSTAWRKIALTPSLWREVSFSGDDFSDGQSWLNDEDVLDRISSVKSLHFNCKPTVRGSVNTGLLIIQALEQILKNSRSLENFNLEFYDGTPIPQVLFDLPTLCPKITGIQISDMPLNNVFFTWIEKYNTNLTKLVLHSVFDLYVSLTLLSQKIAKFCPNLIKLHLYLLTSTEILDLNSIQAGCPKIRELCLKNLSFTDNDDLTSCFRHLEKFCFRHFQVPSSRISAPREILRALRGAEELKELKLTGINLNSKTMLKLPCKSLRKLCFYHQSDNADDLYHILYRWKHSLTELGVNVSCKKKSLDSLFRYIKRYGKDNLESLTLRGYIMSTDQLKIIARLCPKLKCFSHFGNTFPAKIALTSREEINDWLNY